MTTGCDRASFVLCEVAEKPAGLGRPISRRRALRRLSGVFFITLARMGSPLPLPPARLAFSRPPPLACAPAATARPVSSPHRGCSLSFPLAAPRPRALRSRRRSRRLHLSASARESSEEPQPSRSFVQSLRVPEAWLAPPKALEVKTAPIFGLPP